MVKNKIKRRDFMKTGALAMAAAGLPVHGSQEKRKNIKQPYQIIQRPLGRTGLKLPVVSFGVMNSDKPEMLQQAISMGIQHLDTAHVYLRGNSERVIGKVLEETKSRDKVVVSTKMRFARDRKMHVFLKEGNAREPGATLENFNNQLEESLRRLRSEYVDILYLHSCYSPEMALYQEMMDALVKAKKSGKARFIGVSTHRNEPDVIRAAVDTGIYDVIQTAYNYLQKHSEEMKKAIAYAASKGVGIITMKTFGGNQLQQNKEITVNHEAALKWVLQDKNVCTTIPGMTTFEQMELNFRVMSSLALSKEEKRDIALSSLATGTLYCQACESCLSTCPMAVEIPNLMRAYMYARGYGNLTQARITLEELPENEGLSVCRDCDACTARCSFGIDIGARIDSLLTERLHQG